MPRFQLYKVVKAAPCLLAGAVIVGSGIAGFRVGDRIMSVGLVAPAPCISETLGLRPALFATGGVAEKKESFNCRPPRCGAAPSASCAARFPVAVGAPQEALRCERPEPQAPERSVADDCLGPRG